MSGISFAVLLFVIAGMILPLQLHAEAGNAGKMSNRASVADVIRATMTVEDIDYKTRTVTLKSGSGEKQILEVSPEVKRLNEVKKGDQIEVQICRAIAARMSIRTDDKKIEVKGRVSKASPEERPGISGRNDVTATVTVRDIDLENNLVTVTGPAGNTVKLAVRRPEMQAFIEQLESGDKVDVTYTEAMAISLKPEDD